MGARLHQGSALSPMLFAVVKERLKDEVMQEFLLTFIFADNIVICSETKEWVEVCSGEKRMKVSRITEYVCEQEADHSDSNRSKGSEVRYTKVQSNSAQER